MTAFFMTCPKTFCKNGWHWIYLELQLRYFWCIIFLETGVKVGCLEDTPKNFVTFWYIHIITAEQNNSKKWQRTKGHNFRSIIRLSNTQWKSLENFDLGRGSFHSSNSSSFTFWSSSKWSSCSRSNQTGIRTDNSNGS